MRREEVRRELLDGPMTQGERDRALADIDRLSAWFGGYALTIRAVRALLRGAGGQHVPVVVDVGGGRGDLARRLVRRARREGRRLRVVVVDRDEGGLVPGAGGRDWPEVLRVCADAAALPLRDEAVDVATTSLVLHHLPPDAAVATLESMRAVARRGMVVNDLLRTRLSWLLVVLATALFTRHAVARHDGPLSVRRAYAPAELRALCEKAGWRRFAIRRHPLLGRVLVVAPQWPPAT
jgi:ubiquinone/menaquinone biosynthesis C-methylase UbiE